MRLLLATTFLNCLSGSELFLYDLALGLRRRGHEVTVWLAEPVITAPLPQLLRLAGVHTTGDLPPESDVEAVIFQLKETFPVFAKRFLAAQRFTVCHGPKLPAEIAPPDFPKVTQLALTREGYAYLRATGHTRAVFIGYGIDLNRFRPVGTLPLEARTVVVHSKYADLDLVRAACVQADLAVVPLGTESWQGPFGYDHYSDVVDVQPDGTVIDREPEIAAFNVERLLAPADIVVGLGRSAVEAMAMGKACLVFGYGNVGDGMVTSESLPRFAAKNFSGRSRGNAFTSDSLAMELAKYDPTHSAINRSFCERHYSLERFLDRFESLLVRERTKPTLLARRRRRWAARR